MADQKPLVVITGQTQQLPVGDTIAGASVNAVIDESDITIAANYTVTTGKNGISVSPVTLANSVTVTIPTGSVWLIAI